MYPDTDVLRLSIIFIFDKKKNVLVFLTFTIDNCTVKEMEEYLTSLLKLSVKLAGLANVIEVLESSIKGSLSAKLHDLDHLQDRILRTKQVNFLKSVTLT